MKWFGWCAVGVGSLVLVIGSIWLLRQPSNARKWAVDQAILPEATLEGSLVHINNIRNFTYRSTSDYTPGYYDKTFDLSKLERAYYIVEPFTGFKGSAHTFVSFEFQGPEFLAISIEIRKEQGESFSPLKGLLRQYEIMYVIADEQDAIKLRSNYRHDEVYMYPIATTPEKVQAMFVSMLERANKLKEAPEFYNTLTNTCTTNLVRHVNQIVPGRVPYDPRILLPAYSDMFAHDLGLIDTELSLAAAREKFRINVRAEKYADDPNFSVKIREAE